MKDQNTGDENSREKNALLKL